jgi:hypothetical protein
MQRPCQKCGYVSDRPTRFCRQCGAQLFVESEATSAATRQYSPQQPANPYDGPYQSQLAQARFAPENQSGAQTPDTSRLYHDSIAPNYSNYPASYQQAAPKKSGALKWILITLTCVALVSGAISAMVISAIRTPRGTPEEFEPARRVEPPPPPSGPPPASGRGSVLEQYKYPNAKVEKTVNVFGNEVIEMTTNDSVSEVGDYYKQKFGAPMVEADDSAVIFRIPGSITTIITVNQDETDGEGTKITVARTNMQLPKIN